MQFLCHHIRKSFLLRILCFFYLELDTLKKDSHRRLKTSVITCFWGVSAKKEHGERTWKKHCFQCGSSPAVSGCRWALGLHPDGSRCFFKIHATALSFLSLCRRCVQHSWSSCRSAFFERFGHFVPWFRLHSFEHNYHISYSALRSNNQAVVPSEHLFWKILYHLNHRNLNSQLFLLVLRVFQG